jgi:glutamyl-tRNA reductase
VLISLGLDFTHADVGTRESFHLDEARVMAAYERGEGRMVREFMAVNTCNRIELYGWATSIGGRDPYQEMATRYFGDPCEASRFRAAATHRMGIDAVRHLLRVSSGLESQILGDIHIVGQVRSSYRQAAEYESLGSNLHRLVDAAIRSARSVKKETELMAGRSSVGSEAATAVISRAGGVEGRTFVVIGAGKIGSHAASSLVKRGAHDVVILNRSPERGERLAESIGGTAAAWDDFERVVRAADGIIVATGAPSPILGVADVGNRDATRELVIVDIAMPRNADPALKGVDGVKLVDLDQLHPEAASVARSRKAAVPAAEMIVDRYTREYMSWVAQSGAREALRPLREKLEEICRREIEYAAEHTDVEMAATRIVSKLMAQPMTVLREHGESTDVAAVRGALHMLFAGERYELGNRAG